MKRERSQMLLHSDGVARLATDVELRYTQTGTAIASFSVVSSDKYTSNGEKVEKVCFIGCTIIGRLAEVANQWLVKGQQVLVRGKLQQDNWVDKDGNKKSKHSLLLDSFEMVGKRDDNETPATHEQPQEKPPMKVEVERPNQSKPSASVPEIDLDDEEIPF